ncbi:MAG: RdgB/HAM1 family non-canonical purine NTP pyrophosphatase [Clostridia bacterium]|nr:RdgB/HAM1 family non-canonical purine NTP pyrophosphatase [Clostridia bacterium]
MMEEQKQARPRLIVASNNRNKLREFAAILGHRFDIVSMRDAGIEADIEENGATFEENALIKARYVMDATGCAAIADDSGLEVDALGGEPGVYSARYCGRHGDDEANNDLLLKNLADVPAPRTGRYVAAIALVRPGHDPIVGRGTCDGEILEQRRGHGGFGYDPLFLCETGETFAEVSAETKNAISHRRRGIEAVLAALEAEA